ncbi:MAG: hypothetical protein VXV91_06315, partial [Verrucomicrobiota bacterium]|nr:hypothetical protein [Verrucomicrobiota bacterium]
NPILKGTKDMDEEIQSGLASMRVRMLGSRNPILKGTKDMDEEIQSGLASMRVRMLSTVQ